MAKSKQRREKQHVERFLKAVGIDCTALERGADPPDVIVTTNDSRIALEVTEYHTRRDGKPARTAFQSNWNRLWQEIDRERIQRSLKGVHCRIDLRNEHLPSKTRTADFVHELVCVVERATGRMAGSELTVNLLPANVQQWCPTTAGEIVESSEQFPALDQHVTELHVSPSNTDWPRWTCPAAAAAMICPDAETFRVLAEKKGGNDWCVPGARRWLLIVCGLLNDVGSHVFPDSKQDRAELEQALEPATHWLKKFDEVWLFSEFDGRCLRLHPRA